MNRIYRKVLAGCLAALGFAACTTEEPDLYGPMPVVYGPVPEYSEPKEVKQQSRSASTEAIGNQAEAPQEDEQTTDEPA